MVPPPLSTTVEASSSVLSTATPTPVLDVVDPNFDAIIDSALTSFEVETTIPAKFLVRPQRTGNAYTARSLTLPGMMTTVSTTVEASTASASHTTASIVAPKTRPTKSELPDIPMWMLHVLAVWATFMLVVTIVLYFANFPPSLARISEFKRRNRQGYARLDQQKVDEQSLRYRNSAVASGSGAGEGDGKRRRRDKARNLSIDTSATTRGLGIAVPAEQDRPSTPPRRRSYDKEALTVKPESPMKVAWETFTAPLPSVKGFVNGHTDSWLFRHHERCSDAESGWESRSSSAFSPNILYADERSNGTMHARDHMTESTGSAFFRKVNGGIHHAADRLSRTLFDQVNGPEEGLLLPVHNNEREQATTPGLFLG